MWPLLQGQGKKWSRDLSLLPTRELKSSSDVKLYRHPFSVILENSLLLLLPIVKEKKVTVSTQTCAKSYRWAFIAATNSVLGKASSSERKIILYNKRPWWFFYIEWKPSCKLHWILKSWYDLQMTFCVPSIQPAWWCPPPHCHHGYCITEGMKVAAELT